MLLEDRSTDTAENMKFSKELILAESQRREDEAAGGPRPDGSGEEPIVAFSTTNYHVFRSGLKSRRVKLRSLGMGCKSKWYFWPNAAVREFVGLLTQHRLKQALILLSLIVFYTILTVASYKLLF